jgi:hypothetical protein
MSENVPEEPAAAGQELADPVRTGVEDVDAVLASVEDLDTLPVDEHVAVFERAHEGLRGALDPGTDA